MSPPIRPLPKEAAPQRTESDATNATNPNIPAFGQLLELHLGPSDDAPDESKPDAEEKPAQKAATSSLDAAMIFGCAAALAPPVAPQPPVSPAATPPSGKSAAELDVQPGNGELPAILPTPTPATTASLGASLLQRLTRVPELPQGSPVPSPKQEEIAENTAQPADKIHGIADAKQPAMLLNFDKQTESSKEQHKYLVPGSETQASVVERIPVAFRPSARASDPLADVIADKLAIQPDAFTPKLHIEAPAPSSQPAEVRAVPIVESIREHVQLLRTSQQNEMRVLLRPDAQTELLLQVRHIDGQIHVQARCERGDFAWLDSQWSTVQHALGTQGVRVEPLQSAQRPHDNGGSMFMRDERDSQRDPRGSSSSFSGEQEVSKPRTSQARPKVSAPRARGWQSWA
jgi:hypothetical protein